MMMNAGKVAFFEKRDSSDTFKSRTKSSKNLRIMQRANELTVFKCNVYIPVLLWCNDLSKKLDGKTIICVGEPVDHHLNNK